MTTELSKTQATGALALNNQDIDDMFGSSSLEATKLTFPEIAIMRESPVFDLGSGELIQTLTGNVLYTHPSNTWWEQAFNEREKEDRGAPNCASSHGIRPDSGDDIQVPFKMVNGEKIYDLCATCPKFQYGSGKNGVGSACRLGAKILFLRDGEVLPSVISLPPSSTLGKDCSYSTWLSKVINTVFSAFRAVGTVLPANKRHSWPARVEMSLIHKDFQTGNGASILQIKTLSVLVNDNEENLAKLKELSGIQQWAVGIYKQEMAAYLTPTTPVNAEPTEVVDEEDSDNIPI
jgi:hypothetical protein